MATIGFFTQTDNGFIGNITTLTIHAPKVTIVEESRGGDNAPSHRVFFNKAEIGAGWSKRSKEGSDYLSIKIDDPSLPAALYANLFAEDDGKTYALIWNRPNGKRN